jgi:hypothetical protein
MLHPSKLCSCFVLSEQVSQNDQQLQEAARTGVSSGELRQLPGPPVLSTEDNRLYGEIMGRLIHCLAPRDFMEQLLVKELTDCTFGLARHTRHFNAQPQ